MSPPTLIIKNLYLGDYQNATNLFHPLMKELNLKHIINCCKGGKNFFPNHFNYYNLEWVDDLQQDINEILEVISYIDSALSKEEAVFVHCGAGISRSSSVVIAYLMKKLDWNYLQAYQFVKEKRNCIQPNQHFENQLKLIFM